MTKYEVSEPLKEGERATKRLECTCYNIFQDKVCGAQIRIHNKTIKGWRCTVCGKDKT